MTNNYKYMLKTLLGCVCLAGISLGASAYPLSYYKNQSVLAEGKWVKVAIEGEGIFQVTYDDLQAWGFSDPSKVTVWGYSPMLDTSGEFTSTHIDDLPRTASYHTADGRLLFYGESDGKVSISDAGSSKFIRNYYDKRGVYFLTDSQPLEDVATSTFNPSTATPYNAFYQLEYIENEAENPGKGGIYFYDTRLKPGESRSYTFHIKNYAPQGSKGVHSSNTAYFKYDYIQNSTSKSGLKSSVTPNVNNTVTTDGDCQANTNPSYMYNTGNGTLQFKPISDNKNSLQDEDVTFTITNPEGSSASYTAIDRVRLLYQRSSIVGEDPQLLMQYFSSTNGQRVEFSEVPENFVVWNVDNPLSITQYQLQRPETGIARISLKSYTNSGTNKTGPCRIVAFNPDKQQASASFLGHVKNSDIHGAETPEMVIVTTNALVDAARELASLHEQYQGIRVSVFTQEEILNEFSSGTLTPMAIRRMAKMFYDREPDVFKYLLIYGESYWDNRGITKDIDDLIVCFEAEILDHAKDVHRNYTTDQIFGMLRDDYDPSLIHFTPADICVGRIPANNIGQARNINNKIADFLQNPPSAAEYLRITVSSDEGNSNEHFRQSEESASLFMDYIPGSTITRGHLVIMPPSTTGVTNAHPVVMKSLNRGAGFFGYCGHGNPTEITGAKLLTMGQVKTELYDTPVFAYFSSCDLFCFDRESALMDAMLFTPRGGLIAGVGASRSVYLEYNQSIYLSVCNEYATAKPGTTYGQLFTIGRNKLVEGRQVSAALATNALCYNFIGDPALMVPIPDNKLVIETIDGKTYSDNSKIEISPLKKISISGRVTRLDGSMNSSFSGKGLIEVYNTPGKSDEITVISPEDNRTQIKVRAPLDNTLIAENVFNVENGRFTLSIVVPELDNYGEMNRFVLTAKADESGELAAATTTNTALISLPEDHVSDLNPAAPRIVNFYIDTPDFVNGDMVPSEFTLYAEIEIPESGISLNSRGFNIVGNLKYDQGKNILDFFNISDYNEAGNFVARKTFSGLSDGRHNFSLRVGNNLGVFSDVSLDCIVATDGISGELACAGDVESSHPGLVTVRKSAELSFNHDLEKEPENRLLILDAVGNTVYSAKNVSFPFSWNLKTVGGDFVEDGNYTAKLLLNSGNVYGATPSTSFTVIKE